MQEAFHGDSQVSTDKQKRSGLGLAAQKEAVAAYLNGGRWKLTGEFTEVESGKKDDRPQLVQALAMCRLQNATLVVAKLDRLARNAEFLRSIVRESGDKGVIFCDLPKVPEGPTGKFLIGIMAEVAELEAGLIGQRTKAALQAAKARGVVLGCRNTTSPHTPTVGQRRALQCAVRKPRNVRTISCRSSKRFRLKATLPCARSQPH